MTTLIAVVCCMTLLAFLWGTWVDNDIVTGIIMALVAALIGGLVILLTWADNAEQARMRALMDECMADGKQHYECVALFQHRDSTTVVPVPVVIGR